MKRHRKIVMLLAVVGLTTTAGFAAKPDQPQAEESPAQLAAQQSRVNRYFKNKVANAKFKECWSHLSGEGSISMDLSFRKSGGAWSFETVEATGSTLPEEQVSAAVACIQDAADKTSFPVSTTAFYEKDAKEFVLRWTWPVPLAGSSMQTAALMKYRRNDVVELSDLRLQGRPPVRADLQDGHERRLQDLRAHGTPPSNSCAYDKACLSGSIGLR
jgi:hypothetical protein